MKLIIGNKKYSSWSLRPWIAMKQIGLTFEEEVIPMAMPTTKPAMLKYAPTGLVPVLIDGEAVIFETIAILEHLNEAYPAAQLWPRQVAARAHARSIAAQMHGGFAALRRDCPMNMLRPVKKHAISPQAEQDAASIDALWCEARQRFGQQGPFLFGAFTNADAMYAPVVNRLHVYDLPRSKMAQIYMDAMMALPAWQEWVMAAGQESWVIASSEIT